MIRTLLIMLAITVICASCQRGEMEDVTGTEERLPAIIRIEVREEKTAGMSTRNVSEDAINDLHVLVYDKNGELIGQKYQAGGSTVDVNTHSANNCTVYAIANTGNPNLFSNYNVHKEAYLKEMMCSVSSWDMLTKGDCLPMTGSKSGINIIPGMQILSKTNGVTVTRVAAKVTLNIEIKKNSQITITNYQICNLPGRSYYIARTTDAKNQTWLKSNVINAGSNTTIVNTAFYMFENRRGKVNSISKQQDKTPYNAPKNATYVLINGILQGTAVCWQVYLGENNTTDFNIKRNGNYTYKIILNASGKADARVVIDTPGVIDLSSNEQANCYLASSDNQWYKFNGTIRGNGQTVDYAAKQYNGLSLMPSVVTGANNAVTIPATQIQDAIVVWETSKGLIDWVIWDVSAGYVKFKTSTQKGNALIAVRNAKQEILWSWHIWRTNNVDLAKLNSNHIIAMQTNTARNWYSGTKAKRNIKVMDRNLGSSFDGTLDFSDCIGVNGLHYQFGRKDPFPSGTTYNTTTGILKGDVTLHGYGSGISETSFTILDKKEKSQSDMNAKSTIDYTIQHPEVFITGNEVSSNWFHNATYNSNDWKISNCLWGDNSSSTSTDIIDSAPWDGGKTIYDPCPAGWRVAPADTWTGIVKESFNGWSSTVNDTYIYGSWDWGHKFYSNGTSANNTFCPPLGYRDWSNAYLCNMGSYGYYWYSSPSIVNNERSSFFQFYKNEIYVCPPTTCRAYGFSVRCVKIE